MVLIETHQVTYLLPGGLHKNMFPIIQILLDFWLFVNYMYSSVAASNWPK